MTTIRLVNQAKRKDQYQNQLDSPPNAYSTLLPLFLANETLSFLQKASRMLLAERSKSQWRRKWSWKWRVTEWRTKCWWVARLPFRRCSWADESTLFFPLYQFFMQPSSWCLIFSSNVWGPISKIHWILVESWNVHQGHVCDCVSTVVWRIVRQSCLIGLTKRSHVLSHPGANDLRVWTVHLLLSLESFILEESLVSKCVRCLCAALGLGVLSEGVIRRWGFEPS